VFLDLHPPTLNLHSLLIATQPTHHPKKPIKIRNLRLIPTAKSKRVKPSALIPHNIAHSPAVVDLDDEGLAWGAVPELVDAEEGAVGVRGDA
jgi:hypothetical protein